MENNSLSEQILKTINEKHISPKPKWEFWIKDWAVWTAGVFSILIGGVAVGLVITFLRTDDLRVLKEFHDTGANAWIVIFPYFWILVVIGFLALARYNLIHTKRGYRLTLPMFAAMSVGLSIILGVCFYDAGIGQIIDSTLTARPGKYLEYVHPRADLWTRPSKGMLGGVVYQIADEKTIILNDFTNRQWIVRVTGESMNTNKLPLHARIRCIGTQVGTNEFIAEQILPWGVRRTILIPLPPPPNQELLTVPMR